MVAIRALTIRSEYKGSDGINSSFHYCNHEFVSEQDLETIKKHVGDGSTFRTPHVLNSIQRPPAIDRGQ